MPWQKIINYCIACNNQQIQKRLRFYWNRNNNRVEYIGELQQVVLNDISIQIYMLIHLQKKIILVGIQTRNLSTGKQSLSLYFELRFKNIFKLILCIKIQDILFKLSTNVDNLPVVTLLIKAYRFPDCTMHTYICTYNVFSSRDSYLSPQTFPS